MIPDDVIVYEILVRLAASSVIKFRSVCKSWYSLTTKPSFIKAHDARLATAQSSILFQHSPIDLSTNQLDLIRIVSPTCHTQILTVDVPPGIAIDRHIRDTCPYATLLYSLQGSCDGLVCFMEHRQSENAPYQVCNLSTKEWISIPRVWRNNMAFPRAFYYQPSSKEYRLLDSFYLDDSDPTMPIPGYEIFSLKRGAVGSNMSGGRLINDLFYDDDPPYSLRERVYGGERLYEAYVSVHGSLHWAPQAETYPWILAFDVETEKFRSLLIPEELLSDHNNAENYHVIKIGEDLGLCRVTKSAKMELWLLKDSTGKEWIKLDTFSRHSIQKMIPSCYKYVKRYFRPLGLWNDRKELLLHWNADVIILYNLKLNCIMEVLTGKCFYYYAAFWTETLTSASYSFD